MTLFVFRNIYLINYGYFIRVDTRIKVDGLRYDRNVLVGLVDHAVFQQASSIYQFVILKCFFFFYKKAILSLKYDKKSSEFFFLQ
jgi:hypothetical protein